MIRQLRRRRWQFHAAEDSRVDCHRAPSIKTVRTLPISPDLDTCRTAPRAKASEVFCRIGNIPLSIFTQRLNPFFCADRIAAPDSPIENQTACGMPEADARDGNIDHISNHGSTSRSTRCETGGEFPNRAMCGHRALPGRQQPFRFFARVRAGAPAPSFRLQSSHRGLERHAATRLGSLVRMNASSTSGTPTCYSQE